MIYRIQLQIGLNFGASLITVDFLWCKGTHPSFFCHFHKQGVFCSSRMCQSDKAIPKFSSTLNPIALSNTKTVYNFGLSECNRVKLPSGNPLSCKSRPQFRLEAKLKMTELLPQKIPIHH